jgi:uncharacterized membrane protein
VDDPLALEDEMSIGPVELLVLTYDEERMDGLSGASLRRLVDGGVIRVVDAVFVHKTAPDDVRLLEVSELDGPESAVFEPLVSEVSGLIDHDDVRKLTAGVAPGSAAAILLLENVWAGVFASEMEQAGGGVILAERIPRTVIEELVLARDAEDIASAQAGHPVR